LAVEALAADLETTIGTCCTDTVFLDLFSTRTTALICSSTLSSPSTNTLLDSSSDLVCGYQRKNNHFLFTLHFPTGGLVCSRSVKLLEHNTEEPESRDLWWHELRMEVRSHARALACNVVLGYREESTIRFHISSFLFN